ncbi:hypothetical protein, partial [Phenylobacterium sp.]|uniref:hypothetical protein n=1 Tax=Phenylobacterium sp. TaxID=1871053 RepID=UPI002F429537
MDNRPATARKPSRRLFQTAEHRESRTGPPRKPLTPASIYVLVLFMSDAAARRERQDAVLAELSELGLSLARELHARALA